jgi:putative membrane protein
MDDLTGKAAPVERQGSPKGMVRLRSDWIVPYKECFDFFRHFDASVCRWFRARLTRSVIQNAINRCPADSEPTRDIDRADPISPQCRDQAFRKASTSSMSNTPSGLNPATELTMERNRLAADRTMMAWIRTSLALIGFGFGIGKVYDYLKSVGVRDSVDPIRRPLIFGGSFIILGMLALVAAIIQHVRILQRLEQPDFAYTAMRPITVMVALLIGAFGLLEFFFDRLWGINRRCLYASAHGEACDQRRQQLDPTQPNELSAASRVRLNQPLAQGTGL